jgi:hypothetical protein
MPQLRVPTHLLEGSSAWLKGLRDDSGREWTATEWKLAQLAAEAWDRAQTARRKLEREGLTFTAPIFNKQGEVVGERITAHPAANIARDSAQLFSKLVAQLGLDEAAPPAAAEQDGPAAPVLSLMDQLAAARSA